MKRPFLWSLSTPQNFILKFIKPLGNEDYPTFLWFHWCFYQPVPSAERNFLLGQLESPSWNCLFISCCYIRIPAKEKTAEEFSDYSKMSLCCNQKLYESQNIFQSQSNNKTLFRRPTFSLAFIRCSHWLKTADFCQQWRKVSHTSKLELSFKRHSVNFPPLRKKWSVHKVKHSTIFIAFSTRRKLETPSYNLRI